jgi:hypothetical protein
MKVGLCDLHAVCVSVYPPSPSIDFGIPDLIFMKLGMLIMETDPAHLSGVFYKSLPSNFVCICIPLSLLIILINLTCVSLDTN